MTKNCGESVKAIHHPLKRRRVRKQRPRSSPSSARQHRPQIFGQLPLLHEHACHCHPDWKTDKHRQKQEKNTTKHTPYRAFSLDVNFTFLSASSRSFHQHFAFLFILYISPLPCPLQQQNEHAHHKRREHSCRRNFIEGQVAEPVIVQMLQKVHILLGIITRHEPRLPEYLKRIQKREYRNRVQRRQQIRQSDPEKAGTFLGPIHVAPPHRSPPESRQGRPSRGSCHIRDSSTDS